MRDLATELRNYVDSFDEPFDPASLIEDAERVTVTSPKAGLSIRRGVVIGFAAAIIMLLLAVPCSSVAHSAATGRLW